MIAEHFIHLPSLADWGDSDGGSPSIPITTIYENDINECLICARHALKLI